MRVGVRVKRRKKAPSACLLISSTETGCHTRQTPLVACQRKQKAAPDTFGHGTAFCPLDYFDYMRNRYWELRSLLYAAANDHHAGHRHAKNGQ